MSSAGMASIETQEMAQNRESSQGPESLAAWEMNPLYDFPWVVDGVFTYRSILRSLPSILAWKESKNLLAKLKVLDRSVCERRFESTLHFIDAHDAALAAKMRSAFEALPQEGKTRFISAPETVNRIENLLNQPKETVRWLCGFLNAEAIFQGLESTAGRQCWTALGDFYSAGAEDGAEWSADRSYYAPRVGGVPVDFLSPNLETGRNLSVSAQYLDFTPEERAETLKRLQEAFAVIDQVSPEAGYICRQFVKVIMPFKVSKGFGSTSQPRYPGRIMLRGVERADLVSIIGALVHESIHQVLYTLEYKGSFVLEDEESKASVRFTSPWSGRSLELHSFFQACFVWYGLANFWALAESSGRLESQGLHREYAQALSGFREKNPIDMLGCHADRIRRDALRIACRLQEELQHLMASPAAAS